MNDDFRWTDGLNPHLVTDGKIKGCVVSHCGRRDPKRGCEYLIPDIFSFFPMFIPCDWLKPITADEANAIRAERTAKSERARAENSQNLPIIKS